MEFRFFRILFAHLINKIVGFMCVPPVDHDVALSKVLTLPDCNSTTVAPCKTLSDITSLKSQKSIYACEYTAITGKGFSKQLKVLVTR